MSQAFESLTDLLIREGVRGKTVRAVLAVYMDREGVPARSIRKYADYPEILAVFAERGVRLPGLESDLPYSEKAFGLVVRSRRQLRKWTQEHLRGELLSRYGIDLSKTAMSRLEKGERPIRLNEAIALAHLLDVELSRPGAGAE